MADMVNRLDVQAVQIRPWKRQLLVSARVAFDKGDQLADDLEQEVLELRAKISQLVKENDIFIEGSAGDMGPEPLSTKPSAHRNIH